MPELVQSEIAQLLGWSPTKTHFMLKQAIEDLQESLKKANANQLLGESVETLLEFGLDGFEIGSVDSRDDE
jgi:hypothetical protein